MNYKRLFLALSVASILGGCSSSGSITDGLGKHLDNTEQQQSIIDQWEATSPKITYMDRKSPLIIDQPLFIPEKIANIHINSQFNRDATMFHLIGMLKTLGVNLIIPEKELLDKPIVMFDYEGKLGDFLSAIGVAYGVNFNWNPGNIMTAESSGYYALTIPQDKVIAEVIEKELKELGADKVKASVNTGSISYNASYRVHKRISHYLERLNLNTALVSMQVALITVGLDKSDARGIDWSKLNLGLGVSGLLGDGFDPLSFSSDDDSLSGGYENILDAGSDNDDDDDDDDYDYSNNSSSSSESETTYLGPRGTNLSDLKMGATLGGLGSEIGIAKGDFNLGVAIDYLSTFGKTETTQNVILKTLSGRTVKIKSGDKIPYVGEVGIQTGSDSGTVSSNSLGSVNTEEIETGLNIELNPYFSAESELLTIDVAMTIASLVKMVELSAGNQVGTISRPQTSEQEFNNVVTMRAGQSVLLGGLIIDVDSDSSNSPIFAPSAAYSSKEFTRQALFIMLRPSVTVYGNFSKDSEVR